MSQAPVRRVVTGHDNSGQAVILFDGDAPNSFVSEAAPGLVATMPWFTAGATIDHCSNSDTAGTNDVVPSFPEPGQTILRVVSFPPDNSYPDDASQRIFDEIEGTSEAEAAAQESDSERHFWFHRTDSLDYGVVLDGEITLLVDSGETTMRAGDIVVQRATSHAWSNRTNEPARVLFVLIGTPALSPTEIVERRTLSGEG